MIDGDFTLNSQGYEKEDLEDVNKSRTVGLNVTIYPNTTYSQRDRAGNQIYVNGINPKGIGVAVKTGVSYGETDKTREILATVGAGVKTNQDLGNVNRDLSKQVTEFEGTELRAINVDLMTEYWASEAGRGKLRDLIENSERTTEGIKRVLTTRDSNGNLNVLKNAEAESVVQKFTRIGFVETRGKTQQQVKAELENRFGSLSKKGVKVYFYDEKDVDKSLDENSVAKLLANGFAITKDGSVWINKSHVDSGKLIDFNTLTQHEISHILFGEDSEYEAQYVEAAYGQFLQEVKDNGYLTDSQGIIDYKMSMLVDEDWIRLNGYSVEDMQFRELSGDDRVDNRGIPLDAVKQSTVQYARSTSKIQKHINVEGSKAKIKKSITKTLKEQNKNSRNPKSEKEIESYIEEIVEIAYMKLLKEVSEEKKRSLKSGLRKREDKLLGKTLFETALLYFSMNENQKNNILDSVERQEEAYIAKYGKLSDDYISKKLTFFTNNPHLMGSTIVIRIPLEVMIKLGQTEIYNPAIKNTETIWSADTSKKFYNVSYIDSATGKLKSHDFEILDRRNTLAGLQIMTIRSKETGEKLIVAQGSAPGLNEPHKDLSGWSKDWLLNNISGNLSVDTLDMVANIPRYIKEVTTGEQQAYREAFTPIQYREAARYVLDMKKKYGEISMLLGHSLKGSGVTYAGDRTGVPTMAVDPAPNNRKINDRYSHITLLPDNPLLNRTETAGDMLGHYTTFRHYGKWIPTPSVRIRENRYGFGVGATGTPVYRSTTHYTGDPVRYYNENSKMKNIQREIKKDNHKMSEDFNNKISKRDIEAINNMPVRPEGW